MRANGSLKTLTSGVSTIDKSMTPISFLKDAVNWQMDAVQGLHRRPPLELIDTTLTTEYEPGVAAMIPFEMRGEAWWLQIKPYQGHSGGAKVDVYDNEGNGYDVSGYPAYFNTLTGETSVELVVQGNNVFVMNRNEKPTMVTNSLPIFKAHSMAVVAVPPKVFSVIKISWAYRNGTIGSIIYEVGEDEDGGVAGITDPSLVDNGTNTIGNHLNNKIAAQITADGQNSTLVVANEGGTLVFYRQGSGNWGPYSDVAVSDGNNNAAYAVNGRVESIADLPAYSHEGALLAINADPITGQAEVYMRSESVLEVVPLPTLPVNTALEFTSGKWVDDDYQTLAGYNAAILNPWWPNIGNMPNKNMSPWDGIEGARTSSFQLASCLTIYDADVTDASTTVVKLTVVRNGGTYNPRLDYLEIWQKPQGGNPQRRVGQVFLYPAGDGTNGNSHYRFYEGFIDGPAAMADGLVHAVYNQDLLAGQDPIPQVRWIEDAAPGQATLIQASSMPHVLYYNDGSDTWHIDDINSSPSPDVKPLIRRVAGNDENNPPPVFIDKKCDDVALFQGRLALLADDAVSMSVTNQPYNWFRGTTAALLDTSPISIRSTTTKANKLRHFVMHNNNLFLFGPSGQFMIDGRVPITPSNSALPLVSSYEMYVEAKPSIVGDSILFATDYGKSSGLRQYNLSADSDVLFAAHTLTDHVLDLIPGSMRDVVASANAGVVLCTSNDNYYQNVVYVLEWYRSGDGIKKPAWSTWHINMPGSIVAMRAHEHYFDVAMSNDSAENVLGLYRVYLNDRKYGEADTDIYLDARVKVLEAGSGVRRINIPNNYPVEVSDLEVWTQAGEDITNNIVSYGDGTYFDIDIEDDQRTFYYGTSTFTSLRLPDLDVRDEGGVIQSSSKLRVNSWDITLTGRMSIFGIDNKEPYGTYGPYSWNGSEVGNMYTDASNVSRSTWNVPWKHADKDVDVSFETYGATGVTVHAVEWNGQYYKPGRRF